jgi:polyferredoxin
MRSTRRSKVVLSIAILFTFVAVAAALSIAFHVGTPGASISLFGLGVSLGPCLAAYALAPIRLKQALRRLVLFTGGLSILAFSFLTSANIDLEGFFLLVFEGVAGAAVGHTLATSVSGPIFFGRFLCGWGCWRAMILELLPTGKGDRHRQRLSRYLPFAGLAVCIAAAAFGYFVLGHRAGGVLGSPLRAGIQPLLGGVLVYYAGSIALAVAFHDQRAFCKYLCPNLPILRLTSRLSLLKISPDSELCNCCGACSRVCPMDIDVKTFAVSGSRIGTGECILCQRCTQACPTGALRTAIRLH